jgi:hypothetical protein
MLPTREVASVSLSWMVAVFHWTGYELWMAVRGAYEYAVHWYVTSALERAIRQQWYSMLRECSAVWIQVE